MPFFFRGGVRAQMSHFQQKKKPETGHFVPAPPPSCFCQTAHPRRHVSDTNSEMGSSEA